MKRTNNDLVRLKWSDVLKIGDIDDDLADGVCATLECLGVFNQPDRYEMKITTEEVFVDVTELEVIPLTVRDYVPDRNMTGYVEEIDTDLWFAAHRTGIFNVVDENGNTRQVARYAIVQQD